MFHNEFSPEEVKTWDQVRNVGGRFLAGRAQVQESLLKDVCFLVVFLFFISVLPGKFIQNNKQTFFDVLKT